MRLRSGIGRIVLLWVGIVTMVAASPRLAVSHAQAAAPGQSAAAEARLRQQYDKLETDAARHDAGKQAEDWAKMALLAYQMAELHYGAQQPSQAVALLTDASQKADQALANLRAEFERGKTDHMKAVEVRLQEISYQLRRISGQVPLAERTRLEGFYQHFVALDTEVLHMMFTPKSERPNAKH